MPFSQPREKRNSVFQAWGNGLCSLIKVHTPDHSMCTLLHWRRLYYQLHLLIINLILIITLQVPTQTCGSNIGDEVRLDTTILSRVICLSVVISQERCYNTPP